MRVRTQSNLYQ